jgi:hypothetical protein
VGIKEILDPATQDQEDEFWPHSRCIYARIGLETGEDER